MPMVSVRLSESVPADWLRLLHEAAERLDLGYTPVVVRSWMQGIVPVAAVRRLGGTLRTVEPFFHWTLCQHWLMVPAGLGAVVPEYVREHAAVEDFIGLCTVELDGVRFLALRADSQHTPVTVHRGLALAGPSLEAVLGLASRLEEASLDLAGGGIGRAGQRSALCFSGP